MPKYAFFDHWADQPAPVNGWYDTDNFTYDVLPAEDDLLLIGEYEWAQRMDRAWAVQDGAIVEYNPEPPPLDADGEYAARIAAGITLTSPSNTYINGLWALDPITMAEMGAVARDYSSGLGLPLGLPTFTYPNLAGDPIILSGGDVMHVYVAQRDMVAQISQQAAIMRGGGTPIWPVQETTIL